MDSNKNTANVQHLTKASSEELLKKFAEVGFEKEDRISAKKELQLAKRLKRSNNRKAKSSESYGYGRMYVDQSVNLNGTHASIVERKSLLGPVVSFQQQRSIAFGRNRRFGIGKAKNRAREIKNKSLMSSIEKTWRRTIEGASKIFMEKQYNRHKRLANDLY